MMPDLRTATMPDAFLAPPQDTQVARMELEQGLLA